MKRITQKRIAQIVLLLALLFLLLPSSLRALTGNVYLMGEESYYHARIAKQITEQGIPEFDDFVFESRPYVANPYHLLLAGVAFPLGSMTAAKTVPLLLGLLFIYLFYLLLNKFKIESWTKWTILCVMILSPLFIHTFNFSTPASLILVLNLAGLLFLTRTGKISTGVALACFSMVSMFGLLHAAVSAFIVFFYSFNLKKRLRKGYLILAAIAFVVLSYTLPIFLASESVDFVSRNLISLFISDLGSGAGFSIFALLLAIVGYLVVWKHKKKHYSLYAFSILLIVFSFFDSSLLIYANIVVVFLAGIALVYFARMKWTLKILREFTMLVLICGLLFSALSTTIDLRDSQPDNSLVNALIWLELNSDEQAVVFSHYSNGFWIEYLAGQPVVLDSSFQLIFDVNSRYFDSNQIFTTDDLDVARKILSKYDVKYVVITDNLYDGIVWDKKGKGLDFLLENAETFKKVQENSYVKIYEYIYEGVEEK
ncbi:hypothetical protein KY333_03840 [Candidatus Woesearchaeota archaeon]|nr:hypothetical protein [Candidatus Woesearchaeota archaeon]